MKNNLLTLFKPSAKAGGLNIIKGFNYEVFYNSAFYLYFWHI
jgi:hypothetical protein